jgi:hypothetical protein
MPAGWQTVPCLDSAWVQQNVPPPDFFAPANLFETASPQDPLVFAQLNTTFITPGTEMDVPQSTDGGVPTGQANRWSVQNNTNFFTGTNTHQDWVQFVVQVSDGQAVLCVWNIDRTIPDYYTNTFCSAGWSSSVGVPISNTTPVPLRNGGALQSLDFVNMAGYVDASNPANPLLKMVVEMSPVQDSAHSVYAVVGSDAYGLGSNSNWREISGAVFGHSLGSSSEFTNAEVRTTIMTSNCRGDTTANGDTCTSRPPLQNNLDFCTNWGLTAENSNLAYVDCPAMNVFAPPLNVATTGNNLNEVFLNPHLAVANYLLSTAPTGGALGPSHAFVRDNDNDHGAIPSTLNGAVFYESPDIFLVQHNAPVDVNGTSSDALITPGLLYDLWVRVNNELGCNSVPGVQALVYVADPTVGLAPWDQGKVTNGEYWGDSAQQSGSSITVPAGGKALVGPFTWQAPEGSTPHKCILAAIKATNEPAPVDTSDAPGSNQVAQRNIQVQDCDYGLTNATTSDASVQLTLTVTPNTVVLGLTGSANNVSVSIDDEDSSWLGVWTNQLQANPGAGFAVSHVDNKTIVRVGVPSVVLDVVTLPAGQTRTVLTNPIAANGTPDTVNARLQVGAVVTYITEASVQSVSNGGTCQFTANGTPGPVP